MGPDLPWPEETAPGRRVVLVEDHPVLLRRIAGELTDAGMHVVAVGSVAAGHEAVITHLPRVAVVDSGLPDGRGIDLCRALRTTRPDVVLLLHAGLANPHEEREALDAGVTAVVPKAIRGGELVAAVLRYAWPGGTDGGSPTF